MLACVLVLVGYMHFRDELSRVKETALSTLQVRAGLFRQYISLISTKNTAMQKTFLQAYRQAQAGELQASVLDHIRYFPQFDILGLSAFDQPDSAGSLSGTLTMAPDLDPNDPKLRQELMAVLAMDAQMSTLMDGVDRTIWAYYTSASGFLYLVPKLPVAGFRFSRDRYQRVFWSQAEPEANPLGRQIISDLYEDAGGMGMMISISDPVFVDGQFLGVVSLDVGISLIERLLQVGAAVGASCLVDEKQQLVARSDGEDSLSLQLPNENTDGDWQRTDSGLFYRVPVREGELYLVHKIANGQLYAQAARESATVWGLLLLGGLLGYFVYSLRLSVARNRQLMQIDPLTRLYNRRGFHTLLQPIYAQAERLGQSCAVLVIDIDYFKQVNDTYGHVVGDEVICGLARELQGTNREGSLVSRWGGEEFLVFLQGCDTLGARTVAKRIHQQVAAGRFGSRNLTITVSIGACAGTANLPFEHLLQRADKALYQAKQNGRNQTVACD